MVYASILICKLTRLHGKNTAPSCESLSTAEDNRHLTYPDTTLSLTHFGLPAAVVEVVLTDGLLFLKENTLDSLFHVEVGLALEVLFDNTGVLCWCCGFSSALSTHTSLSVKAKIKYHQRTSKGYTNH